MDPECKKEWKAQMSCFAGVFMRSVGMNEGFNFLEIKDTAKNCLTDAGCQIPKSLSGGGDGRRVKRGGGRHPYHSPEVIECMKGKFEGKHPKEVVKQCIETALPGVPVMDKWLRPYHGPRRNDRCPYRKVMLFLSKSDQMEARLAKYCGDDQDKADQVVECMEDATGVDLMNIDREQIREDICSQKETCFTEKLSECRESIQRVFDVICDCKMAEIEPKRVQCMEELGLTSTSPYEGLTCSELKAKVHQDYDMCADGFEWPEDDQEDEESTRRLMRLRRHNDHHDDSHHGHGRHSSSAVSSEEQMDEDTEEEIEEIEDEMEDMDKERVRRHNHNRNYRTQRIMKNIADGIMAYFM
jgi:hypothetical protein